MISELAANNYNFPTLTMNEIYCLPLSPWPLANDSQQVSNIETRLFGNCLGRLKP